MLSELIARKLSDLPNLSGVYVMLDDAGKIIYVGKAVCLKNRVKQYFQSGPKSEKVAALVSKIADFYYIITNSEQDALVLEANLIKKHKPQYNILLKDDKYFPYIKINMAEAFPKLLITRKILKDNAKYFGPFMGGISVREIVEIISSAYQVRTCSLNLEKRKKTLRPCLNYHIKKCLAPCAGYISEDEYGLILNNTIAFLKGNDEDIENLFNKKMLAFAESEEFELALEMKKALTVLEKLKLKKIVNLSKNIDIDIYAIVSNGKYSAVAALYIRDGRMIGAENTGLNDASLDDYDTLRTYLLQVYDKAAFYPDEIVISVNIPEHEELEKLINLKSGKKVNLNSPKQGVRRQLCLMAENNAKDYLEKSIEKLKRAEELTQGACDQLCTILNVKSCSRIECYDISNISGIDKTASMAVMINGSCINALYRRFKIKTVDGADDYKSLHETLSRRLEKLDDADISFSEKPDLIIIDGGLGQLNAVKDLALNKNIPIISIAKKDEEIYTVNSNNPIRLLKSNLALRMVQRIRDEAHRFAVTYHRKLRDKTFSVLEEIDNIGPKKRAKLLKHFKSVENIRNADIQELTSAGVTKNDAERIKKFFQDKG